MQHVLSTKDITHVTAIREPDGHPLHTRQFEQEASKFTQYHDLVVDPLAFLDAAVDFQLDMIGNHVMPRKTGEPDVDYRQRMRDVILWAKRVQLL